VERIFGIEKGFFCAKCEPKLSDECECENCFGCLTYMSVTFYWAGLFSVILVMHIDSVLLLYGRMKHVQVRLKVIGR